MTETASEARAILDRAYARRDAREAATVPTDFELIECAECDGRGEFVDEEVCGPCNGTGEIEADA